MKLIELHESAMSERHLDLQEKIMALIGVDDTDAVEVLEFALGTRDWEDLSDVACEKLYSHYEQEMPYGVAKARTGNPDQFIGTALTKDLKL